MRVRSFTGSGRRFRATAMGGSSGRTQYIRPDARDSRCCCVRLRAPHRVDKIAPFRPDGHRFPVVTTAAPLMTTRLDGREPDRRGKVRDLFDAGSSLAHRRHRPHLGLRLRARQRHPRQGQGAHAAVGVLVRAHDRHRAEPPARHRSARRSRRSLPRTPTCWRDARCWCARPRPSRSSAWRAAICRARAGRTISRPAPCAACACRHGLRESDRLPRADLHAGHQGGLGARHQHHRSRRRLSSSARKR